MRVDQIVTSPFQFTSLKTCSISHEIGNHSRAQISGYINESNKDSSMNLIKQGTEVKFTTPADDILFIGIIKNGEISKEGDRLYLLTLSLVSYSFLLDNVPKTRIFQQPDTTYQELLKHVNKTYSDGGAMMSVAHGESIKEVITQYRETDWEFVPRMASHFNQTITPAYLFSGEKYYFGTPDNGKLVKVDIDKLSVNKAVGSYTNKSMNDVGVSEADEIGYTIVSRDVAKIADSITIEEVGLTSKIYASESYLEKEELVHTYHCKPEKGF